MTCNAQRQAIPQRIVAARSNGCAVMGVPPAPEHGVTPSCVVCADAHGAFAFTARSLIGSVFHFLAECHLPSPVNIARYNMLMFLGGASESFVKGGMP